MSLQKEFLNAIKNRLPEHISFVDELAELFNVSNDSAYRRLRGDTSMTFEELAIVSQKYNISLDSILGKNRSNRVSFKYNPIEEGVFAFDQHFESLQSMLGNFGAAEDTQMVYAANEAKFGLLHVPEVAAFKLFFWMKTSYGLKESQNKKFDFDEFNENYGEVVKKVVKNYVQIPTIEIINEDYLNSTFNQIKFYYESGFFNTKGEALMICDKLKELVNHNKREAELGYKYIMGQPEAGVEGNLNLYHNEVINTDNVVAAKMGDEYYCYLVINTVNFMLTSNRKFSKDTYDYLINLRNKSTLISVTAERERNMFYNKVNENIDQLKISL